MIHLKETKNNSLILTLNKPQEGNSLGKEEARFFATTLKKYKKSNLIVCATGQRFFCTGGNLTEQVVAKSKQASFKTQVSIRSMMDALNNHPRLTIALVGGDCFGGGMEFLSAFDYVISAPHAVFGLWQRKLGLSFGWGGGRRLLKRGSMKQIKKNLLLARSFCAEEALNLGFVDEILPCDHLLSRAEALIERHEQLPQNNFSKIKNWNGEKEESLFSSLWMKTDHQEALRPFRQTR